MRTLKITRGTDLARAWAAWGPLQTRILQTQPVTRAEWEAQLRTGAKDPHFQHLTSLPLPCSPPLLWPPPLSFLPLWELPAPQPAPASQSSLEVGRDMDLKKWRPASATAPSLKGLCKGLSPLPLAGFPGTAGGFPLGFGSLPTPILVGLGA